MSNGYECLDYFDLLCCEICCNILIKFYIKVIARQVERRLEESKVEAGQLRNRLTLIEKNINDLDPEAKLHRKYNQKKFLFYFMFTNFVSML